MLQPSRFHASRYLCKHCITTAHLLPIYRIMPGVTPDNPQLLQLPGLADVLGNFDAVALSESPLSIGWLCNLSLQSLHLHSYDVAALAADAKFQTLSELRRKPSDVNLLDGTETLQLNKALKDKHVVVHRVAILETLLRCPRSSLLYRIVDIVFLG
jgi:hypothetical protein